MNAPLAWVASSNAFRASLEPRKFPGASECFELPLCPQRFTDGRSDRADPQDGYGQSGPRILRPFSCLVLRNAPRYIQRDSAIEGIVGATKHVQLPDTDRCCPTWFLRRRGCSFSTFWRLGLQGTRGFRPGLMVGTRKHEPLLTCEVKSPIRTLFARAGRSSFAHP